MTKEIRKAFEAVEFKSDLIAWDEILEQYDPAEDSIYAEQVASTFHEKYLSFKAGIEHQQKRIDELETLLNNLAIATNNYRNYHDLYGRGDLRTGRAWDEMARYERKAIYGLEEQAND